MQCEMCEQGIYISTTTYNDVVYRKVNVCVPCVHSVCSHCGVEVALPGQTAANAQAMRSARQLVDTYYDMLLPQLRELGRI